MFLLTLCTSNVTVLTHATRCSGNQQSRCPGNSKTVNIIETKDGPPQVRDNPPASPKTQWSKVYDRRKRRIRGLWKRGGRFYAQLNVPDPKTGRPTPRRISLPLAKSEVEALTARNALIAERDGGTLVLTPRSRKTFTEVAGEYFTSIQSMEDGKSATTIRAELAKMNILKAAFGPLQLSAIREGEVMAFMERRQNGTFKFNGKTGAKVTGGTLSLDIMVLRNVLRFAKRMGYIIRLPVWDLPRLDTTPAPRAHIPTWAEIETLCACAIEHCRNGQQLSDYVKFMCLAGSRRSETLMLQWSDVNFDATDPVTGEPIPNILFPARRCAGREGRMTKSLKPKHVMMYPLLLAHVKDMATRRMPGSPHLFPSPLQPDRIQTVRCLVQSLKLARKKAGMPWFNGFHLCRHYNGTWMAKSGVTAKAGAEALGHHDGGKLYSTLYSHSDLSWKMQESKKLTKPI